MCVALQLRTNAGNIFAPHPQVGEEVQIQGLVSKPELNGIRVAITAFLPESGRFAAKSTSGSRGTARTYSLKAENLKALGGAGPVGCALSTHLSALNHSCVPTANARVNQGLLHLNALVPIKKDDEITISYIDTNLPVDERRKVLLEHYRFVCCCAKCEYEAGSRIS